MRLGKRPKEFSLIKVHRGPRHFAIVSLSIFAGLSPIILFLIHPVRIWELVITACLVLAITAAFLIPTYLMLFQTVSMLSPSGELVRYKIDSMDFYGNEVSVYERHFETYQVGMAKSCKLFVQAESNRLEKSDKLAIGIFGLFVSYLFGLVTKGAFSAYGLSIVLSVLLVFICLLFTINFVTQLSNLVRAHYDLVLSILDEHISQVS